MKQHSVFPNLFVSEHPLVGHKLSHMRQIDCDKKSFKQSLKEISWLLGYEVTSGLATTKKSIKTPVAPMEAPFLRESPPVILPILRAGIGMSEGLEDIMPDAPVGHIGLYRDEVTKRPVEYLVKLPPVGEHGCILVDPMLATGHSAKYAIDILVSNNVPPSKISLMVLVAAPEGVKVILEAYPEVMIYTAALDERLNEKAYIVPGLGDAGDRLFGTTG